MDRNFTALVGDLTAQVDAEIARAVSNEREQAAAGLARTIEDTRRRLSESLNQTLRRIRQTQAEHEALQLLVEESAPWAERAVVVLIESNQARLSAWRGVTFRNEEEDAAPIELSEAAALASCAGTRDPLVALAAPAEISAVLARTLGKTGSEKVYLFPVTVRQNTVAILLACSEVTPAPIELLCEAAGMKLESLAAAEAEVPVDETMGVPLVQIAAAANGSTSAESKATTWTKLTPEQQALHLRAQRMARVKVAQIRISDSEALRKGAQTRGIYAALRPAIDAARREFAQAFISQTPTMVDYLHLEIIRSLAHEDSGLLGESYPGPLA